MGLIEQFVVEPTSHNRGIGGALLTALVDVAENWLNLSRIQHTIAVDNAPAIALHRKHGFLIEGKLRDHNFRAGRYVDAYVMARIRDDRK
jgi:putative acetyltransferase